MRKVDSWVHTALATGKGSVGNGDIALGIAVVLGTGIGTVLGWWS